MRGGAASPGPRTHHVWDPVRDRVDVLAVRAHHRALLDMDLQRMREEVAVAGRFFGSGLHKRAGRERRTGSRNAEGAA